MILSPSLSPRSRIQVWNSRSRRRQRTSSPKNRMVNVRRVSFRGFHNNDPKQLFQSSVDYTHALETPPGELPPQLKSTASVRVSTADPVRLTLL